MQQGKALYQLQEIDLALVNHQQRIEEIERELADNAAVKAAQQAVDNADAALKPLKAQIKDYELQMQTTKDKRARTEKRLYSGTVTNPKELQDMQQEMESLKNWLGTLEDRMLEVMVAADEAQATLDTAQDKLDTVTQQAEADNADLTAEKQERLSQMEDLRAEREQKKTIITDANLKMYNDLRPKRANRPIAKLLADETCSICGVKQTSTAAKTIRRSDDLNKCSNCMRVLVAI